MLSKTTLVVNASSRQYPILFAHSLETLLLQSIDNFLTQQVVIITNTTLQSLYLKMLESILRDKGYQPLSLVLPDGEEYKNNDTLNLIYDALLSNQVERNATLIALGGGVIGDMVGFAAATYQRGVPFIQIPTTLLSQVDSSVGGKTAINHPLGKNMIGAFYQPQAVLIGQNVLHTLPKREFAAGMAEVVKYALGYDEDFFVWLEQNVEQINALEPAAIRHILYTCCRTKAAIVAQDEKESGVRALLNLGHTFGHVIEVAMGYGQWLHGEAVAAGLILAAELSEYYGCLTRQEVVRLEQLLKHFELPTAPPSIPLEQWFETFHYDKKVKNGIIRFITLQKLGKAFVNDDVSEGDLRKLLEERVVGRL